MDPNEQRLRSLAMTTARHVAKAVDELEPEHSSDFDVVAFVLRCIQEEHGPMHWSQTPPYDYVFAVNQFVHACRRASTPSRWYEELKNRVAALEETKGAPASLSEIGTCMKDFAADPREELVKLPERHALAAIVEGMRRDADVTDDEALAGALATVRPLMPTTELGETLFDAARMGNLVSSITRALRKNVALRVAEGFLEGQSDQQILAKVFEYTLNQFRRLNDLEQDPVFAGLANLTKTFLDRCRQSPDTKAWFTETYRYIDDGFWRTRRSTHP